MDDFKIINADGANINDFGLCGYKNEKREGYKEKLEWAKKQFLRGLRIKFLYSEKHGTQGMIEYIPAENSFRPIEAAGFLVVHCVFVGFKKEFKGRGYASLLIKECFDDAKKNNFKGVTVVCRDGSFMAGKEIFLKNGFEKLIRKKIIQNFQKKLIR